MDRISAVLFLGIVVLVMISSYIIYDTWMEEDDMEYEVLVFNDDTSFTNSSDGSLWLRAQITDNGSIDDVRKPYINDKSWIKGEDGWHYYVHDLGSQETTAPFVVPEKHKKAESGSAKGTEYRRLRIRVEAVDQAWLSESPSGSKEAFEMLRTLQKEFEPSYL